eukprot:CAMPEP_0174268020 /NCGR_PEP_ID=MMETSP0439-20130205/35867_1 /TAXON_ID=0 /ORGANISM="Stereomyxa ramosa, Strain Chinc5" /LENGTH=318 /DNA_ID=CAMNT_0015355927 /DNA_START=11 /DNA_END=964 /DNA_ORIENTATION=+
MSQSSDSSSSSSSSEDSSISSISESSEEAGLFWASQQQRGVSINQEPSENIQINLSSSLDDNALSPIQKRLHQQRNPTPPRLSSSADEGSFFSFGTDTIPLLKNFKDKKKEKREKKKAKKRKEKKKEEQEERVRTAFIPERGTALANRLKYYENLTTYASMTTSDDLGLHKPPEHVLPAGAFVLNPWLSPGDGKQQHSIITIFSIWNTMMGTSLLALPWGFTQSGFACGLATVLVIGILCCYSCLLIVKCSKGYDDFMDVTKLYLGKIGVSASFVSSVLVLTGAVIAFDILMSDSLETNIHGIIKYTGSSYKADWLKW